VLPGVLLREMGCAKREHQKTVSAAKVFGSVALAIIKYLRMV
jgi:hypothetical protein